ncbi:helix-turn-helix transcriptional regulator [Paracoccus aminophilus]|uniref:helix-turn-helix transcriptional regulator n=1 Tax=Paracoccus aminophilus TaxID=34003 RepID=UPI00040F6BDD|nr:LuxR C-terminal-related transcriptional regulator [Paracoccus aminophilus]
MIAALEAKAVAALIASGGGTGYGAALDGLAALAAPFDMSCAFAFSADRAPVVIHDGYSATVDRRALRSYLRGAYLLDPFYSACVGDCREGLWRMRDLAPDGFYESEFAWSREVHPCISDEAGTLVEELGFTIPLSEGFAATYSLMRNRGGAPFDETEFAALARLTPIIAASLRQHWLSVLSAEARSQSQRPDPETVFRQAFGELLTPAQHAVTKLILRGHSNISIAAHLGITEGTVKIHRSNIYRRLGISSQSELFQRFIDQLAE